MQQEKIRLILKEAKLLIAQGWCQETMARDTNGNAVPSTSNSACEFCIAGAIHAAAYKHVNGQNFYESARPARMAMRRAIGTVDLPMWNDWESRTQSDVLHAITKAIALLDGFVESDGS